MKTLLCADFEFHDEIYSKIPENNQEIEMDYVRDGEATLEALGMKKYDFLITTIVMPKLDGFNVIDRIYSDPDRYGKPKICVLTGLGGDLFMEQIKKRNVGYIYRNDKTIKEIQEEITRFLKFR